MEALDQGVLTMLGAVVVALGTYLGIRWISGGQVQSSEASQLWHSYNDLQDRLEQEIARRDIVIDRINGELVATQAELTATREREWQCLNRCWRMERALIGAGIEMPKD